LILGRQRPLSWWLGKDDFPALYPALQCLPSLGCSPSAGSYFDIDHVLLHAIGKNKMITKTESRRLKRRKQREKGPSAVLGYI
jgi:hypothetical protein